MSILDLLSKAGLAVAELREFILRAAALSPDLSDQANALVKALDAATSPEQLAIVGQAILAELGDIGRGKLDGRSHPSDAA